jgi:hypothetical protein
MIIPVLTTGSVAIGKIDVLRIHAAELYVAPAIGEFFGCKCWRSQAESFYFGQWADVERAHGMLAMIRSAMEREVADFFETRAGGENPKMLAASFSQGMGLRVSQRLRRLKAGRGAKILARAKDLTAAFAKLHQRTPLKRDMPTISTIAYAAGVKAGDRVELIRCLDQKGGRDRSLLEVNRRKPTTHSGASVSKKL